MWKPRAPRSPEERDSAYAPGGVRHVLTPCNNIHGTPLSGTRCSRPRGHLGEHMNIGVVSRYLTVKPWSDQPLIGDAHPEGIDLLEMLALERQIAIQERQERQAEILEIDRRNNQRILQRRDE